MKASKVLLALVPVLICQCSRASYVLSEYKEYCGDDLERRTTYHYEGNTLCKSVEISSPHCGGDSIVTFYETVKYEDGVDSIKTTYGYSYGGEQKYASKEVKSCTPDGIYRRITNYELKDNEWKEIDQELHDSKGRWIDYWKSDWYHSWCSYDSLDRYTGKRYIYRPPESTTYKDTVIYSADNRTVMRIESSLLYYSGKEVVNSKQLYKLDKHGWVLSVENVDPDENDDKHPDLQKTVYKLDRKGRVRRKSLYRIIYPYTEDGQYREFKYRYRHGLRTSVIDYTVNDGKKSLYEYRVYKYDCRHKLLHEEAVYDDLLRRDLDERKVWTYEKENRLFIYLQTDKALEI